MSVISQKDESQNGVSRKQNTSDFRKNEHFYSLIRTRTVYGSENGFHIKEVLYYFTNPPKNMMVKSALGDLTFILLSKSHPVLGDITEL